MNEEDKNCIQYFWQDKNDLERWLEWETRKNEIAKTNPEIIKAWEDYKTSIKIMDAAVNSLN